MTTANFSNRTVWVGDNLQVMRGINSECVDLIYLDPPFNSNQDYAAPIGSIAAGAAFKDTWTLSDIDVHEHGELADRNPAAYTVIEAARASHGKSMMSYLIMMAVRLLEMQRILKPTGSIYLHCDPTASHYLQLLMDSVFGSSSFRNEIIWKRTNTKGDARKNLPKNHDVLLRYSKSEDFVWNPIYVPHDPEYIEKFYRFIEEGSGRRYRLGDLTSPQKNRPNLTYDFLGVTRVWRWTRERMQKAYEDGIVIQTKPGNVPAVKRYLDQQKGTQLGGVWSDIKPVQAQAKERIGYPTQKPIALLDRIIEASSNEGDAVFDPFCGCATTLVAADRLERRWAGIDLSPLAVKLVNERISDDRGALWGGANVVDTLPMRTDLGELPNYRTHRHRLYGEQEGICVGCGTHFPFKVMEVDHILPKSRGGTDHLENLQLLCTHCNKSKGNKTMAEWRAGQTA
jgi:site-specific DNA-methyltransferase (adenine-specific)